jgi:2-succinyl-5-enolpyruvyl-6-hydroxy-3-cyclohexene-1-carboxylate synthase
MYRFQYRKASDKESLEKELNFFFETTEHPQILEVFTPTYENDGLLKNYFKALK